MKDDRSSYHTPPSLRKESIDTKTTQYTYITKMYNMHQYNMNTVSLYITGSKCSLGFLSRRGYRRSFESDVVVDGAGTFHCSSDCSSGWVSGTTTGRSGVDATAPGTISVGVPMPVTGTGAMSSVGVNTISGVSSSITL